MPCVRYLYAVNIGKYPLKKNNHTTTSSAWSPMNLGGGAMRPGWSCEQSDQLLNTEDGRGLGVWSTLAKEEGIFWYVGEGWEKSRGLQRLKQVVGSLETVGIGYHFYR